MQQITLIPPQSPRAATITLPGSKSITNRALLVAALASGTSHITGALKSDDTHHMAAALRAMGVSIVEPDTTTFTVTSSGALAAPASPLFLGNAGTAMRFLTAASSLAQGEVTLTGEPRMHSRPIGALTAALRSAGVTITDSSGCPPVTIHGTGTFPGGDLTIDGSLSSQFVSALLLTAPRAAQSTTITLTGDIGAAGYLDLTLAVLRAFGAQVTKSDTTFSIAPTGYSPTDYAIEPDASAATYFWALESLLGLSLVPPFPSTQPDSAAHDIMKTFPRLPPVIQGEHIQDAIPTLAALAALAEGETRFTGIANLRVKECDRITAMCTELNKLSPHLAREAGDDLIITGTPDLATKAMPATIDTYRDHRIAMSFGVLGTVIPGITIVDPACTAKTFPTFWDELSKLGVTYV